jgi:hypothetical protein
MTPQVTENVPSENAKILCPHLAVAFSMSECKLIGKSAFVYFFLIRMFERNRLRLIPRKTAAK